MATSQAEAESIETVRRFFEEAFTEGDLDVIDEVVAADAVGHDPAQPGEIRGAEGMKALVSGYRSAFPDISFELHETVTDGEWVGIRWTSEGTHEGELMGIEPTGEHVEVEGIELDRVVDGKIVESRVAWDALGLLQQIGVVPEMAA
jgi:steroid delta-isomerase-like uncharacterized protein